MTLLQPTDEQRRALEDLGNDPKVPARLAIRARIVLALAAGMTNREASLQLGVSAPTVALWRDRFRLHGVDGLSDLPRPGRPPVRTRDGLGDEGSSSEEKGRPSVPTIPELDGEGMASDSTLDRLLEAAARTIGRRGFASTRVTDIAREAGVSPATIHYHFKTRREILVRALLWANEQLVSRLEEISARDDPITRFAHFVDRTIPYPGAQKDEYLLEIDLWSQVRLHPELLPAWESFAEHWISHLTKLIEAGVEGSCFRTTVPAVEVAERLVALTDGLAAQSVIGSERMPPERLRALVLRFAAEQLDVSLKTLEHHVQLGVYRTTEPDRRNDKID
jgi:AcrR family transcriptional regulator